MVTSANQTSPHPISRLRMAAPKTFRRRRGDAWVMAGGLGVVGICMFVVRNGEVNDIEESVFLAINGLPDALREPMWVFQLFGMLATVALAAIAALVVRRYRLGVALALTIPMKLALEWWVVKALVERERPAYTVPEAIIRDSNTAPLGFPSGHAVFAFAIAGLLAPYLGRRGVIVVYVLASCNGLARVYLGAHNPLDVVAGAALGAAIAGLLNLATGVPRSTTQSAQPVDR